MSADQFPPAVLNQLMLVLKNDSTALAQLLPVLEKSLSNEQLDAVIKSNFNVVQHISENRLRALLEAKIATETDMTKLGLMAFPPAVVTASRHCSTCGGEGHNTRSCTAKDMATAKIVSSETEGAVDTSDEDEDM